MATEAKEYDLADKNGLADFLEDADIQLGGPGTRRISKDALRVIVRNLKGDRFTVDMLQDILQEVVPDREGLLSCEDLARRLRRPDPAPQPQKSKRYDLAQKQGLADFLKDADIRLVRADFILKLHREGQRLPRRQEAESAYVDCRTALVTHEEVQVWADGKAREHCDPYGYQVSKLAKALTGKEWVFIDYVSLHQFQSLEIVHCELGPKLPLLLKALEKIKLRQLHLQQNELFEEGTRQVIEALALQSNGTLAALSLAHDGIGVANVKALAEALRTNSTLIELNLIHACLSIDDIIALAEGMKQNRTLKQLSLAGLDLTGCDLGKAAVALARGLRTGQVKGTVTHPAVEFLCMLEARVLSLKRGKFFITSSPARMKSTAGF
ncbi:NLRC3 [Symbiodinium necroappetens]|uniref:NLRC3 protein n=1 Tax=Symbiodinium necroappetens TaxID=1628268 RepID=A0A812VQ96_9DINO|nr:NLRC3 [Symbiodinium necroappetens]